MILYRFPISDRFIKIIYPQIQIIRYVEVSKSMSILKEKYRLPSKTTNSYNLTDDIIKWLTVPDISYRIEQEKEYASFYGIEMRYPFFDLQLLSFFLGLPSKYKMLYGQGRRMYREAIKKRINFEPYAEQRKSRISMIPGLFLKAKEHTVNASFDWAGIEKNLPNELKEIIHPSYLRPESKSAIPPDPGHQIRLAEISGLLKKYKS